MKEQIEDREKKTSARNDRETEREKAEKGRQRERVKEKDAKRKSTVRG